MVSKKVTESVPQTSMFVYRVSFSATFLDVNFGGTNALKLQGGARNVIPFYQPIKIVTS